MSRQTASSFETDESSRFPVRLIARVARPLFDAIRQAADALDERRARRRRATFGASLRLLSWQLRGDGRWLARLSGPGTGPTIERAGRTRMAAIGRASRVMRRLLRHPLALNPSR